VGHARSFLLAWWSIRSRGGQLRLRLEDLDLSRVKPGMVDTCLRDLEWLGLDWDGEVDMQSSFQAEFYGRARELERAGQAYSCVCTRREIAEAQSAPHAEDATTIYPGTCRGLFTDIDDARAKTGREPALRLRVEPGDVTIQDVLHGELTQDVAREVGDFPITSRDGQVAYQLAVVLDDARQGVTEVLRGDDLLSSTPRQALLQRLLNIPRPTWVHVPLVLDVDGERLAKRHDALALQTLREGGLDPGRLVAWIARSAGILTTESVTPQECLAAFDLQAMPPGPVIFDPSRI